MIFAVVVPNPPAQVVTLMCVFKMVTERPETPLSESAVHPVTVAIRWETPPITTGAGATTCAQRAAFDADAGADVANGVSANDNPPIKAAMRRCDIGRRI